MERITVTEGRVVYRDGVTGRTRILAVERFRTEPVAASAGLLRFDGAVTLDELPVTVAGEVGGPERLFGASEASPWPVRLEAASGGAEARVEGTAAQPLKARGWRVAVAAKVPDLARFAATAPNLPTPPLRDIDFAATLADPGPEAALRLPRFADLRFSLGANDLSWIWPGLRLSAFRVDAPRDDAPFALEGEAAAGDLPLRASGKLGAPRSWLVGAAAPEPWPIDLGFAAGPATATVKGRIADVTRGALGFDLELAVRVPDLAGAIAARRPALATGARPGARLARRGTRARLRGGRRLPRAPLHLIGRGRGGRPHLYDRPALGAPGRARFAAPRSRRPAPAFARRHHAARAGGAAGSIRSPPRAAARNDGRVIPDVSLPLAPLRLTDGNLRWTVEELLAGGVPMRQVLVAVAVENGRARLDPFAATLPGGRVMVRGSADSTAEPPSVQVSAHAEGIDLAPMLAALRAPQRVRGRLDLDADLRGAGSDLRSVAGGLSGHLGLALVDGAFDTALLQGLPAELRRALLPQGTAGGDAIPLRCGALRLQAEAGTAQVRALLLETGIGRVGGAGGLNLRDETLALRLLPDLRVGNIALRAPVTVAGTLAAPRFGVSPEAAAAAGLGALLSLQRTPDRELQALAGVLGGGDGSGSSPADCASQLAMARGGRAGAVPSSRPSHAPPEAVPAPPAGGGVVPRELPRQAEELLRGLFGRGR